jgi:hypothetical protein
MGAITADIHGTAAARNPEFGIIDGPDLGSIDIPVFVHLRCPQKTDFDPAAFSAG